MPPPPQIEAVVAKIESLGYEAQPMPGGERVAIAILRNPGPVDPALFVDMPGVIQAIPVSRPYKLVSREMKREDTVIHLPGLDLGRRHFVVIAGPCAVESETQALTIAAAGQGRRGPHLPGRRLQAPHLPLQLPGPGEGRPEDLGEGAGRDRAADRHRGHGPGFPETGGRICRHHPDRRPEHAELFSLLRCAGRTRKPVLLKRGMYATLDEWFMAAEYIMSEGNSQVILCERGVGPSASMPAISWTWPPSRWCAGRAICPSSWTPATPPGAGTWWPPWPGPRWPRAATG